MSNPNPDMSGLKKLSERSPEERSKIAKMGQAASAAKRRENNSLRKALQMWLESDSGVKDKDGTPLTGTELMVKIAVREAAKGNPKFWEIIRDTAGQKPVEQIMVAEVDPAIIDEVEKAVMGTADGVETEETK